MMPRFLTALAALAALVVCAAAAVPASALAGPWHEHTLATGEPTFLRGLDARSDHVRLLVDERHHGTTHQLELRVGTSGYHLLDTAPGTFDAVQVGHDAHGGEVVAWARVGAGGGIRQTFVWSPASGRQELDTPRSVVSLSLAVAPDGSAVLGVSTAAAVYAARSPAGGGPFGTLQELAASSGLMVATGAGPGGRGVVAWPQGAGIAVASAAAGAPGGFIPAQAVALPAAATEIRELTAASTPSGRTAVAAQVGVSAGGIEQSTRVDAFDWAPDAAAPSPARTLSTTAGAPTFAGPPALVARGETVVAGWTETTQPHVAARVLRTVRWSTGADPGAPADYRPARGMGGYAAPLIATAASGAAAAAFFYRPSTASASWFTVSTDARGAAHGASSVTAPGERSDTDLHATLATAPTVAWTTNVGGGNAGYRVRAATP